ncbi:hypothetical protein Bca4012_009458 [Brassica carinata]|uniref:Uncharacterized protein n=1 Tax=Brassica carinata TaxID=52824 RepID=A0A8X7S6B4_BRACI|nr:hypothetical protein Bca52824_034726 [Brassica carinata]
MTTTAARLGRDPLFLSSSSSSKSVRAAAIKIRFADIIVKSSSNKSEAMMKIRREKQILQRKQLQEKARIEARMKIRQEARLAVMKVEEDARSDCKFELDNLSAEKEVLNLIGGSRKARDRSLLKQFGLVLKTEIDDDLLDDLEEDLRDDKLFLIDHHVVVHVTSAEVLAMTTAASLGRDPLFLSSSSSSSKSVRAAAIKIRFADIIVKSSSNKSEAMMKIRREKQILQRKQLQEKARIEARMKIRQEARLAVMKVEEDARSDCKFEHPLSAEKEVINLIGGSRKARDRSLLKQFGLVLKTEIDDDLLDDLEEGEIF